MLGLREAELNQGSKLCQEPFSSLALPGLLYEEDQGSNPPSPHGVRTELSKKKKKVLNLQILNQNK